MFDLNAAMQKKGVSQAMLVKLMGEPQWRVSRWMTGLVKPDADQIVRIADALGMAPGQLFKRAEINRRIIG